MDPTYPLFPIVAFISFLVCLIPLPWHVQAWNSGTCAFMVWTAIACLIEFVNAIVWRGNVNNPAPIWCDISSKLVLGVSIGIPAATLCISRRLYNITAIQTASVTREDKLRMVLGDLCIAVGIPILIMILHVVVQPHRFDILEDIGCYPAIYNTLPAYFLYFMWPPLLGLASFVYSGMTLRSFWVRRVQFSQLLSSNSSMNPSRYLRLMLLALIDMMFSIPLSIYSTYIANEGVGLAPWISWEETHFNFARVASVPAIFWRNNKSFQTSVELTRWLPIFCAILFFALFGFASEARKQYSTAFWWVAKRFGFNRPVVKGVKGSLPGWNKSSGSKPVSTPTSSLPIYSPRASLPKKFNPINSLSSSLAGSELELDTYTEIDIDLEKSAGLTSPPDYSQHNAPVISDPKHTQLSSPGSSRTCLDAKPSQQTLRSINSHDRMYISDTYHDTSAGRTRTPSPAPFSDVVVPPFHRPFTPPNVYPVTMPHPGTLSLDAIRVTVHTQSHSTDAL